MEKRPDIKYAVPKKGMIVRDPRTMAPLPDDGLIITWIGPEGRYWRRREKDGSILVYDDKPAKKETPVYRDVEKNKDGGSR